MFARTHATPSRSSLARSAGAALGLLALFSSGSAALASDLAPGATTRVADPKLDAGGVTVRFFLSPPGTAEKVIVEALAGTTVVRTISTDQQIGSSDPVELFWDGRDWEGHYLDTGSYTVRVRLASGQAAEVLQPVSIVRLGTTEIEARSAGRFAQGAPATEHQMVYFKKGSATAYYVTPAIHEYLSTAEEGEVSDLDYDNGEARWPAPLHTLTDEPVMEGSLYETEAYNYPLCYHAGARPHFALTFGDSSTSASGAPQGVGYPVPGIEIRAALADQTGSWSSVHDLVVPGGEAVFDGPKLPGHLSRTERRVVLTYRYSENGGATWHDIPGSWSTDHRFYTIVGTPNFATDDTGQQYGGPWVEVADYASIWAEALGIATHTEAGVVAASIQGFFGQQGPLLTAIEGVIYDAYPLGGDGGANHYFINSEHRIELSDLLNMHANGVYVNCSDCAGSTSTMIAMLGVDGVQLVHLGNMYLKAIWGIGAPGYTTNLWGGGPHAFSYHKIITRDAAVHVSDACMCVDEDGNPQSTPGVPGYNCDREWAGQPTGYMFLAAYNNVSKTLQALPKIR